MKGFGVEDGLSDCIFCACIDFIEVVVKFAFRFNSTRIGTDPDEKSGGWIDLVSSTSIPWFKLFTTCVSPTASTSKTAVESG